MNTTTTKTANNQTTVLNEEFYFNQAVKAESELRLAIEKAVSNFIKAEFGKLPEDFECFLQLDGNGVSLISGC